MPTGSSNSRVIWDDATEKHLLILILLQSKPQVDWALVAKKFGQNVSPSALMQKYQKIRKRDAAAYGMDDGGDGLSSTSATPNSAGKRGRGKKDDVTDDEEIEESPTKKAKKSGRVPKSKVEKEAGPDEYADSEADTVKKEVDEAENGVDAEYEEA